MHWIVCINDCFVFSASIFYVCGEGFFVVQLFKTEHFCVVGSDCFCIWHDFISLEFIQILNDCVCGLQEKDITCALMECCVVEVLINVWYIKNKKQIIKK